MNRPLVVIFAAIGLDAVGAGLIFPILPRLLEGRDAHPEYRAIHRNNDRLYAVGLQFVFAPVLGALSDNLGRRPCCLFPWRVRRSTLRRHGIRAAALDAAAWPRHRRTDQRQYLCGNRLYHRHIARGQASPPLRLVQRHVYGAYHRRSVLGGLLGDYWVRLPFIAAAVLNTCNLLLALFILPESRAPARQKIDLAALNPLRPLRWVFSMQGLLPITLVFFILSATGEVYGTCWALWGFDTFHWNGFWIGLSLGAFGVCQTLVQALLPGPATNLLGERRAVLVGIACACIALIAMAFASQGWIVFAIMPVFALGSIGTPALQALATRMVDPARQGRFQGVLASAVSLASIVGPLASQRPSTLSSRKSGLEPSGSR